MRTADLPFLAEHSADLVLLIDALPGTGRAEILTAMRRKLGGPDGGCQCSMLSTEDPPVVISVTPAVICAGADQVANLSALRDMGHVQEIGNRDLFLGPGQDPHFAKTGGWPALSDHLAQAPLDDRALTEKAGALLRQTPRAIRDIVARLCRAEGGFDDAELPAEQRKLLHWLDPLSECRGGTWRIRTPGLAAVLRAATDAWSAAALAAPPAPGAAKAARIAALLHAGDRAGALDLLHREGGQYFMHLHGMEAGRRVADAFGEDPAPAVMALQFMIAVKSGDIERAAYILSGYENGVLLDLGRRMPRAGDVPVPLAFCRIELAVFRGEARGYHITDEASDLLARTDPRAHLMRGGIYNLLLDHHIRGERFAAAEEAATRALAHYEAADAPYLSFFIHLHRSIIKVRSGEPAAAAPHLQAAEKALAKTPFEIPQDARFLALMRAVTAYETGDALPMVDFAESAFEGFAYGEIWPSIAALALAHGAEALLQERGLQAATHYIDSWRVPAWRTRNFQVMVAQRRVATLQSARRWREARQQLESMASRIGFLWMESSGANLADLRAPEDISQALLWLRQQVFETPRNPALNERLAAMMDSTHVSTRQRLCLRIWKSWVDRRQNRPGQARRGLADLLQLCASRNSFAPVLEERAFVLPLLEDPRVMQREMIEAPLPRNLRRGAVMAFGTGPLSRQEWRALLLLGEGCSNKDIAREMAVSLPTVKFHLKNLFKKLGVSDRREAVEEARHRGMLSE
ncbi:regulatory protein, luxR family [Mameliella alba]|uniref:helix-turn-helix transcriptional regulator n=4 Tax=Mameliella alba TaxID=561184 RepID=UPI00088B3006|nr:LuxR C-terminal-related transcriptional regulator [Mameliella alba]PTR35916.1 regulatory LuxR family protein [Mameliella alba]SDE07005.1 regulatory protein, luxR family [Mameliella alba]